MNLQNLTLQVVEIANEVALFIREERKTFNYTKAEIKGLNDLVSYVDKTSEIKLIEKLKPLIPTAHFLAEESVDETKLVQQPNQYQWIIDPLDGTTNFIHGIPCYAISIALEFNNEIILGVVFEVAQNECFYAFKHGGAYLNGNAIKVSDRKLLTDSLIATGFPVNNFSKLDNYLTILSVLIKNTHGIRRIGAAAADLCYLACGRVDAFFEYNLKPWDVAAGAIIVKEAGGTICDFSRKNNWLYGKEIIATNALLKNEFETLVETHFKD